MRWLLSVVHFGSEREPLRANLGPFLRGISMGALVGAAIAGSTIWRRRSRAESTGESRDQSRDEPGADFTADR